MKNGLIVNERGDKFWFLNDQHHRDADYPAVERHNGDKEWWQYGKRHRLDGPAYKDAAGYEEWWVHGTYIECSSQEEFLAITNPKLAMFW
jgi:hypothetical protein